MRGKPRTYNCTAISRTYKAHPSAIRACGRQHPVDAELAPHPAHVDRFVGGMGTIQFVRTGSGRIEGFDFVGENLGRLRFARKP